MHERGWSDNYLIGYEGLMIGYGVVKGNEQLTDRDTLFEFYIIPPYRKFSQLLLWKLIDYSNVTFIECQSNDRELTSLLYMHTKEISSGVVLFKEGMTTALSVAGVAFRAREDKDSIFTHEVEPVGEYVLQWDGTIVATGGFALHYNLPFSDLYMEVRPDVRRRGFGSFLIQELKRMSYLHGRVPAARCHHGNTASKATLEKAGMQVAGHMLLGSIKK